MKTVTSLTAALIASVALVGFSSPASASRMVDAGKTENFTCTVDTVKGPDTAWLPVGTNISVSRTKFSLKAGTTSFRFDEDKHESRPGGHGGSYVNYAFYDIPGSNLEFMLTETLDDSKPAGKMMSYRFLLNDGPFSKNTTTKVYGSCQRRF